MPHQFEISLTRQINLIVLTCFIVNQSSKFLTNGTWYTERALPTCIEIILQTSVTTSFYQWLTVSHVPRLWYHSPRRDGAVRISFALAFQSGHRRVTPSRQVGSRGSAKQRPRRKSRTNRKCPRGFLRFRLAETDKCVRTFDKDACFEKVRSPPSPPPRVNYVLRGTTSHLHSTRVEATFSGIIVLWKFLSFVF